MSYRVNITLSICMQNIHIRSTPPLLLHPCLVLSCICVCWHLSATSHLGFLIKFYLQCLAICMVTCYRMASMPTTRLHLVGIWRWTLSCLKMFMQWSIRRTIMGALRCTGQLGGANARWHAIWLKNIIWIHRTGTRCVEWKGRSCACPKCRIYTWCIIIVAVCDAFNSVTIFDKLYVSNGHMSM